MNEQPGLRANLANSGRDGTDVALMAKQPIFDLQGAVWGYELRFRDPSQPGFGGKSAQTATVMLDGFSLLRPTLRGKQRFLVNFTDEFLDQELPHMLQQGICVIEILESVEPTKAVLQGLVNLKQQGYTLVLDDYIGQESLGPFLPLVDIVKAEVLGQSTTQIINTTRELKAYPDVQDVLAHGKGPLAPWYGIMAAYEQGLWDEVHAVTNTMNISDKQLTEAYVAAGKWVDTIYSPQPSK